MSHFIEVDNLRFKYDEKMVIDGLSFGVDKGEFVAIIGINGTGKSTLAKLLSGLEMASEGSIKIDGQELNNETIKDLRKKMGIIFQNPDNQFVGVTVRDDIAFGLENNCVPREEIDQKILEFSKIVGVDKMLSKSPDELSGGEKQRVAIAGVLALNPEILILDEATSMLDPKGVEDVNRCINTLKGQKTIFSITHNLREIVYASKVLVIKEGKLVAYDTPENVLLSDILNDASLDYPDEILLYKKIKQLNINKELEEKLWKLIFMK